MRFGEFLRPDSALSTHLAQRTFLDAVVTVTEGEILDDLAGSVYPSIRAAGDDTHAPQPAAALDAWQRRWRLRDAWAREAAAETVRDAVRLLAGAAGYVDLPEGDAARARSAVGQCWPALTRFDDWADEIGANAWSPGLPWSVEEHRLRDPLGAEIGEVYGAFHFVAMDEVGAPILMVEFKERWMALAWTRAEAGMRLTEEFRLTWWRHVNPDAGPNAWPGPAALDTLSIPAAVRRQFKKALRRYLDEVEARATLAGWERTIAKRAAGGGRRGNREEEQRTAGPERHYTWLAQWQVLGRSDAKIAQLERLADPETVRRARTALARERIELTPRTSPHAR